MRNTEKIPTTHQEDDNWKAKVHLNVKIPPSVARHLMEEQNIEAMIAQEISMALHHMGCPRDNDGNFISPSGDMFASDLSEIGSNHTMLNH